MENNYIKGEIINILCEKNDVEVSTEKIIKLFKTFGASVFDAAGEITGGDISPNDIKWKYKNVMDYYTKNKIF